MYVGNIQSHYSYSIVGNFGGIKFDVFIENAIFLNVANFKFGPSAKNGIITMTQASW